MAEQTLQKNISIQTNVSERTIREVQKDVGEALHIYESKQPIKCGGTHNGLPIKAHTDHTFSTKLKYNRGLNKYI